LAVSRSLGDFIYKSNTSLPSDEQTITANPDIFIKEITKDDEFIVLACDGNYCVFIYLFIFIFILIFFFFFFFFFFFVYNIEIL